MGKAFFPRTDPGQFVVNVKVPAGTRIELTNDYVAKMEQDIRRRRFAGRSEYHRLEHRNHAGSLRDLYIQLRDAYRVYPSEPERGSQDRKLRVYGEESRRKLAQTFRMCQTYFQAGGLVDSVVNQGKPAPIDIQIGGNNLQQAYELAQATAARKLRALSSVSDVLIPQDLDYPGLELKINREHAALLGCICQRCCR